MPTTLCPSCRNVVADEANACPGCGLAFAPVTPAPPMPLPMPRPGVPVLSTPPRKSTPVGIDPYVGSVVAGRFRIEELIGQGGMGRVYRATHLGLDKTVCLKTLKPSLVSDETVVGRFEREAKAASRLDHPNSIQVLDFGQDELGNLFLVMEYVPGRDLRRLLRDEFPLAEARVVRIVSQVLAALSRAHAQGVIHRDLKPENVLVTSRDDEPDFVKVLDFGIAKMLDPTTPGLTRADMICGTPEYMSPEQAMGRPLDARADLYAVGVILYQCFAGFLPFDGDNPMEVLQKQVNDRPRPPKEALATATCSDAMQALVLRALEKDPRRRPQTADEFRRELLALGQATPPPAPRAPSPSEAITTPELPKLNPPAPRPSRDFDELDLAAALPRSRAPIYLSLVVAALALVVAAVALLRSPARPPDRDAAPEALKAPVAGGLTQQEALDLIESHQNLVEHCFRLAARSIRGQSGQMVLSIAIGADGRVTEANIPSSTANSPRIEHCLVEHAKAWTFPPPQRPPMLLSYTYRYRG